MPSPQNILVWNPQYNQAEESRRMERGRLPLFTLCLTAVLFVAGCRGDAEPPPDENAETEVTDNKQPSKSPERGKLKRSSKTKPPDAKNPKRQDPHAKRKASPADAAKPSTRPPGANRRPPVKAPRPERFVLEVSPANATVTINGSLRRANARGKLTFFASPQSKLHLKVTRRGYAPFDRHLTVTELKRSGFRVELPPSAAYHFKAGQRSLAEKKYPDAVRAFSRAIEIDGQYTDAYVGRATAHREAFEFDDAIHDYRKAAELATAANQSPAATSYHAEIARLDYLQGDVSKGLKAVQTALKLSSAKARLLILQARLLSHAGRYEAAVQKLNQAHALQPKSVEALLQRGLIHLTHEEIDKAITDFDAVLKRDPKNFLALLNRGVAHVARADFKSALSDFDAAVTLNPQSAEACFNRGCIYDFRLKPQRALEDFSRAIRLEPKNPHLYSRRADLYLRLNRPKPALKDALAGLNSQPGHSRLVELRDRARHLNKQKGSLKDIPLPMGTDAERKTTLLARLKAVNEKLAAETSKPLLWEKAEILDHLRQLTDKESDRAANFRQLVDAYARLVNLKVPAAKQRLDRLCREARDDENATIAKTAVEWNVLLSKAYVVRDRRSETPLLLQHVQTLLKSPQFTDEEKQTAAADAADVLEKAGCYDAARRVVRKLESMFPDDDIAGIAGLRRRLTLLNKPLSVRGKVLSTGKPLDASSLRGKVVLVDFWASWCAPCVREMPKLKKAYAKYHRKGFEIVGITWDTERQAVRNFAAEHHITWPLIFSDDPEKQEQNEPNSKRCGVEMLPRMLLINQHGIVVSTSVRGENLDHSISSLFNPPNPTAQVWQKNVEFFCRHPLPKPFTSVFIR